MRYMNNARRPDASITHMGRGARRRKTASCIPAEGPMKPPIVRNVTAPGSSGETISRPMRL
jgi:hypothetical protein